MAPGAHRVTASAGDVTVDVPLTVMSAAPTATPDAPAEPTCVARAVSGATIQWGVKQSFRDYIAGPIAGGEFSVNWGTGSGAYNVEADRGRVAFGGTAYFTGHGGQLDVQLSNPRIQITSATSASLIANVMSKGYNGTPDVNADGVVIATLALPPADVSGGQISWQGASATLTASGARAFAGFYEAGVGMDAVSFTFPLGAEVECDATTDGELAATGGDAPIDLVWMGLGMLIVGAGLLALRRRAARV